MGVESCVRLIPMCGKFTAMASWAEVLAFTQPLAKEAGEGGGDGGDEGGGGGGGGGGGNDAEITYRVNGLLPVIVWDAEAGRRKIVKMRWGFPDPKDWRRPRPIHARAETVHEKHPFRLPFAQGQRGIVIFRTFNEGEEVMKPSGKMETRQWRIDPRDGQPRPFAFVWQRFEIADQPMPMLACVMATVPANELIRTRIMPNDPDPRMPAILDHADIATWLGENGAPPAEALATLRTMEGVHWEAEPEPKAQRKPK